MGEFSTKSFRVLIVDDTADIHQDIRGVLSWGLSPDKKGLQNLESLLFSEEGAPPSSPVPLPDLRIDSAYHGEQALEMVRRSVEENEPYQLIFMDVRMPPGADGIQSTQSIWQILPDVNVVICTAYSDYSIDNILEKLGISDKVLFLSKPFSSAVLKQSAITMLKKWDLDSQVKAFTHELEQRVSDRTALLLHNSKFAALGKMAGGIAHEINTPLGVIQLTAEELGRTPVEKLEPVKTKKKLDTILMMVVRIAKIVSALRTVAVPSSSSASFQTIGMDKIIADTNALCGDLIRENGISLEFSGDQTAVLDCRPDEILRVLVSLLNNASDAISALPQKWIHVDIKAASNKVQIQVVDSGEGVSPQVADKIFDPFFTTKEFGKGTGLGLSISKGLIESHRGELTLDTKSKNTSFVISLPAKQRTG